MNAAAVETLFRDLGTAGAEDVICRAMEDLGHRLLNLQAMAAKAPPEDLHKALRALAAVADQVGLSGMAAAARACIACIEDGDPVAESATLGRVFRLGERSLLEMCSLRDLSL